MFNICNFSSDSDCSYLFDGIPVYITALQALLAALLIMTSVPVNILLITSMIVYREMLDTSIILAISFLISNISVSVFLSGEIFLTSVARAWLFDYWGCQLIAFLTIYGTSSRWIIVGFLSIDRYCRVFYPFSYPRHDKKVIMTLLVVSVVLCAVLSVATYLGNATGFDITLPGCSFVSESYSPLAVVIVTAFFVICGTIGCILPTILYTLMYIKAKHARNAVIPTQQMPDSARVEANKRSNRAALVYFLIMGSFNIVNFVGIIRGMIVLWFQNNPVLPPPVVITILYGLITIIHSYVIGDFVILLSNRDQRKVFVKLLKKLYNTARPWELQAP